jgi:outer membrane protein assembly factor BamB
MQIEEKPIVQETPAVTTSALPARPARTWWAAAPVAAYWGYLFLSDWLELSTFARFASRLLAGALLTVFALVWWWINRKTTLRYRLFGFVVVLLVSVIAVPLCDHSSGVAGPGILSGPLPFVVSVWILAVLATRRASLAVQRIALVVAVSGAWTLVALVRMNGLTGDLRPEFHWRWNPTPEQTFLAEHTRDSALSTTRANDLAGHQLEERKGDWPAYRGPDRDGTVRGSSIRTDWKAHLPQEVWRRRVGPAWSSIVVVDGRLITQEQRAAQESVVCYDAATGDEIWSHGDDIRFSEETAGAGPRATPCFAAGRVFALGCTGLLNCLDAATGEKQWSHDLTAESGAAVPHWGFTGSPLVVNDLVVVFAGGTSEKNLLAYRVRTGEFAWAAAAGESSYSSPQLVTLGAKKQILMLTNNGLTAVDPETGAILWEHPVPLPPSAPRAIQPRGLDETRVLVASEGDLGLALLDLRHEANDWKVRQRWASKALKPAFNDFVITHNRAYGFDGRIFTCVDLDTGSRLWKEGRYGEGQVLLLADQSLLLVVSETGEVILLRADPERSMELGRFQALHGRTWNHPAIVNGRLYVRNAEEMACYDVGK